MIAFFEIVAVMYVYGHEKFTEDIEKMTGVRPGLYWQVTWYEKHAFITKVYIL